MLTFCVYKLHSNRWSWFGVYRKCCKLSRFHGIILWGETSVILKWVSRSGGMDLSLSCTCGNPFAPSFLFNIYSLVWFYESLVYQWLVLIEINALLWQARRMFEGEMASLEAILKTQTIKVPKPIKVIELPGVSTLFVMEHLEMRGLNR